jgi:hypothetical protein
MMLFLFMKMAYWQWQQKGIIEQQDNGGEKIANDKMSRWPQLASATQQTKFQSALWLVSTDWRHK